jgi:hypothetical protein
MRLTVRRWIPGGCQSKIKLRFVLSTMGYSVVVLVEANV